MNSSTGAGRTALKPRRKTRGAACGLACAAGGLIGGNLNTMEGFFGTEYMPEIRDGDILFLEDLP